MRSKPTPARPELDALIEKARHQKMTPEEVRAQARSWVIGNVMLSNPNLTREEAERAVDKVLAESVL